VLPLPTPCGLQGLTILEGEALASACSGLEALALRSCTLSATAFFPTLSTSSTLQRLTLENVHFATEAVAASLATLGAPGSLPALKEFEVSRGELTP
jgi:hypothetical protein